MKSPRSNPSRPQPQVLKYIDFEVLREKWSRYKLEDDSVLKSKFVLINVLMKKELDEIIKEAKEKRKKGVKVGFGIQARNVIGIVAPEKLRGEPSGKYTRQELRSSIVKEDMNFEILKENWNEYKLKNGIHLRIRNSVMSVSRTSKFDDRGSPIYLVDSTADVKIKFPKMAEGKFQVAPISSRQK